ncbi:MAG: PspC domain-containing protein [Candidatus Kerfeldbacteria bacterium]|nr:PspC domain-containing protein [Candidatus Kerfeldbacteria bacterium]
MATTPKKLHRSQTNRMIAGVCGGLGEYFGIDPTLVRVVFAVMTVFWGAGLVLYIALAIIIPLEGVKESAPSLGARTRGAAEEIKDSAKKFAQDVKSKKE